MTTVSTSKNINQPVDKVFDYMIDVENHKAWHDDAPGSSKRGLDVSLHDQSNGSSDGNAPGSDGL